MFDFSLTTKPYVTDAVLEKLEKKVEFFLNSKLEPTVHAAIREQVRETDDSRESVREATGNHQVQVQETKGVPIG